MRPIGDYRAALRTAARELGPSGGTWHEMAQRAQLGREVARRTAENMRRGGELVVVGYERMGSNRPAARLAAADLAAHTSPRTATSTAMSTLATFATLARALAPSQASSEPGSWLDFV